MDGVGNFCFLPQFRTYQLQEKVEIILVVKVQKHRLISFIHWKMKAFLQKMNLKSIAEEETLTRAVYLKIQMCRLIELQLELKL